MGAKGGESRVEAIAAAVLLAAAVLALCALLPPPAGATSPSADRIVGGQTTTIGQWPWTVGLSSWGKSPSDALYTHYCGGSLVSERIVLTAAHCVLSYSVPPTRSVAVVSGRTALDASTGMQTHVLGQWVPTTRRGTPKWGARNGGSWDVALLHLAGPTAGTPIQIAGPAERSLWTAGTPAWITGWGSTHSGGHSKRVLRVAQIAIDPNSQCADPHSYGSEFQGSAMLCASAPGKDTCQGDSGGPLVVAAGPGEYRLVGDTSFGRGCAKARYPGIYGRLAGRMRSSLQLDALQLDGANIVSGPVLDPPPAPSAASVKAAADAYAARQCRGGGEECHDAAVSGCEPLRFGYTCTVALHELAGRGPRRRSTIRWQIMLRAGSGDAAVISMLTPQTSKRGWK